MVTDRSARHPVSRRRGARIRGPECWRALQVSPAAAVLTREGRPVSAPGHARLVITFDDAPAPRVLVTGGQARGRKWHPAPYRVDAQGGRQCTWGRACAGRVLLHAAASRAEARDDALELREARGAGDGTVPMDRVTWRGNLGTAGACRRIDMALCLVPLLSPMSRAACSATPVRPSAPLRRRWTYSRMSDLARGGRGREVSAWPGREAGSSPGPRMLRLVERVA